MADELGIEEGIASGLVAPDDSPKIRPDQMAAQTMQRLMAAYKENPKKLRAVMASAHLYLISGGAYDEEYPATDFFFEYADGSESALSMVAATVDAIVQNTGDDPGGPMSFLTTSDWTLGPECILGLLTIVQTFRAWRQGNLGDSGMEKAATLAKATADVAKSGATMANAIANLAHGPGTQAARAVGTVAQQVAAPSTMVSSLASIYLENKELNRLRKSAWSIRDRLDSLKALDRKTFITMALTPGVVYLIGKVKGKLGNLKVRSKGAIGGATVSLGTGAFTTLTVFGLVNCWNPAGWIVVGASLLVGAASLGYKPARRLYKKKKLTRKREEGYTIPAWLNTTGDWHRFRVTDLVIRAALLDSSLTKTQQTAGQALAWVLFGGESYASACLTAITLGYPGVMRMLKTGKLPLA